MGRATVLLFLVAGYLAGAWFTGRWPFEVRWEGYLYPESQVRLYGLDKSHAILVDTFESEDVCIDEIDLYAEEQKSRGRLEELVFLDCEKTRAFSP